MPRKTIDIEKRFWNKVNKTDSCYLWTGATNDLGYGVFYFSEAIGQVYAHRFIWERIKGSIPEGFLFAINVIFQIVLMLTIYF